MLCRAEFQTYLKRLAIPDAGIAYLQKARGEAGAPARPARNVQSRGMNVIGSYASFKVGFTQDYESRRGERLLLVQLERDLDVLEFHTQIHPIPLSFKIQHGAKDYTKSDHVPDVLVLHKLGIHFVEAKPKSKLEGSIQKGSTRFACDANQHWTSPPGEKAAAEFGFGYKVWYPESVPDILRQNIEYLDSVSKRPLFLPVQQCQKIIDAVASSPGITLKALEEALNQEERLAVQWMIGRFVLYCHLDKVLLVDTHRVRVYLDARHAHLYEEAFEHLRPEAPAQKVLVPHLSTVGEIVTSASAQDLSIGLRNLNWVKNGFVDCPLSERQQRRILHDAKQAQSAYGTPVAGVISRISHRGNRGTKIKEAEKVEAVAKEIIALKYASKTEAVPITVYHAIRNKLRELGLPIPGQKWFYNFLERKRTKETEEERKGSKALYFSTFVGAGIAGVSDTAGRHPFDVVHIDHTELELIIVDEETGEDLGRPWLTLVVDAYTGAALSWYLSFRDPSVNSLLMVFRRLVMLHETFPFSVVSDNGADFYSNWYLSLLARMGAEPVRRPPSKPRFGAIIERTFGIITSELLYSLIGNTQRLKVARTLLLKDHPANFAAWTLPNLNRALESFFASRAEMTIPQLGRTRKGCINDYLHNHGRALAQRVKFDNDFYIQTLLETRKGTCKVQRGYGIKFQNEYYSHPALESKEDQNVRVLYDPDDVTGVYVLIGDQWVRATSKHEGRLQGYSRREIEEFSKQYRRRFYLSEGANSEKKIDQAAIIEDLQSEEEASSQHRRRAIATRQATPPAILSKASREAAKDAGSRLSQFANPILVSQSAVQRDEIYSTMKLDTEEDVVVSTKPTFAN
jgi:putative transposase